MGNNVDLKLLLKTLNVKRYLDHYGIKYGERRNGTELMLRCVNKDHEDKSGDSLHMNARNDDWNGCFKCQPCGLKGSFLSFLKLLTNNSTDELIESLKFFGSYTEISKNESIIRDRESAIQLKSEKLEKAKIDQISIEYCPFSGDSWDMSISAEEYMNSRKILKKIAVSMNIGWNNPFRITDKFIVKNAIVCPVEFEGKFVSYFLRCYSGDFFVNDKGKSISKLIPPDAPVGKIPYRIDSCDPFKPTIIVEGVFDALVVLSAIFMTDYDFNVICVWSNNPTEHHIELIRERCHGEIIFMHDRDSVAGSVLCDTIGKALYHEKELKIALIPWGQDPGSCSKDQIIEALSSRESWHEHTARNMLIHKKKYCDF